jgi:hypothetical protein
MERDLAERGWDDSGLVRAKLIEHSILMPLDELDDLGAQALLAAANVGIAQ